MAVSEGFAPVASADARILILGSLPGRRSISAGQYYAHPRNAFWPIMEALFAVRGSYSGRCAQILANQIALWDVLKESVRPGSLDADIDMKTIQANDFTTFLETHRQLKLIAFNGRKAEQLFVKHVSGIRRDSMRFCSLPSSSPAYAAMPFSDKLAGWRSALMPLTGALAEEMK